MATSVCVFIFLCLLSVCHGTPTLTSSATTVVRGSSLTLTCSFPRPPGFLGMTFNSSLSGYSCAVTSGACTAGAGLCTGNTLSCSDDSLIYTLVLGNVNDSFNAQRFFCHDSLNFLNQSNVIQIFVLVPVSTVTIIPSSSQLDVVEGDSVNMICRTDSCRPQPNVTWYRNNFVIVGTTQRVTSVAGDKYYTTSVFTVIGDRNLQGLQIYCSALNIQGRSPVTSNTNTINVLYAPSGTPVLTPSNPTVRVRNNITLTCTLSQYGNPPAAWSWACEGRNIQQSQVNSNAGQSVLRFSSTKTDDGKRCSCKALSNVGNYNRTSSAFLNVQYPPEGKPVISYRTLTYLADNTVTLSCSITNDGNPLSTWTWRCGRRTFNSGITNSVGRSNLTFIVTKADNNQPCTCKASSSVGPYNQTSNPATLDIRYPPEGIPQFVSPVLIHNESITVSFTCFLSSNGNPPVSWIWKVGSRNFTSGYITNTGSQSTLRFQIRKAENGRICRCRAVSSHVSYDEFNEISLDVRYPSKILSLFPSSQSISENQILSVIAMVEGNPYPAVQWINDDNKTTLMLDNTNSNISVLRFDRINCLDTATYTVNTYNGYGNTDSRDINISVLCPPRSIQASKLPVKIVVKEDKMLHISFVSVGNPMPTSKWYFRRNQLSKNISLEDSMIISHTKRIGKVTYETTLKMNLTSEDFGEYFAELENSQGDVTYIFEVVSQGRPDPPTDLAADCSTPLTARLYWVSQFNGLGEKEQQHFYILYKINGTDTFTVSSKVATDSGWGRNLTGSLKLNSGVWIFEVEVRNTIGSTQSVSNTSCYVKDTAVDPPESLTSDTSKMAGMYFAGFFSSVLIFGSILLIIFLKRKGWRLSESPKRTDNTYDSIQTSSREPNTYDDLSKNKQKDPNVYMNTSFGN